MITIWLDNEDVADAGEVAGILKGCNAQCIVIATMPVFIRCHFDVAIYYAEIAFVGEELAKICKQVSFQRKTGNHSIEYHFFVEEFDVEELADVVSRLSYLGTDEEEWIREDFAQFEGDILEGIKGAVAFPELVDDYFANMIGSNYDWSEDEKREAVQRHPEWAYHAWKSPWSHELGFPLFVSPEFWLIPAGFCFREALHKASDIRVKDSAELIEVLHVLMDENCLVLITESAVLSLSLKLHSKIAKAGGEIFRLAEDPFENAAFSAEMNGKFHLAESGDFLVFSSSKYQYLLFRESYANITDSISHLTEHVQSIISNLLSVSNEAIRFKCDWSMIDYESFENLVFDLVLKDRRFRSESARKMGLTCSADGGRDIVIDVKATGPQVRGEQWIIQCKFSRTKKTLGRNDVSVSELLDEYAPAGIIIATNLTIDAGTHDKFSRIQSNRNKDVEGWDGLRLERLLNQNPDLYKRYFGPQEKT